MTAKKPQDHKATQAEKNAEKQERFEDVEGNELLIPFSRVKGSDQTRIIARVTNLFGSDLSDVGEVDTNSLDLEKAADLIDFVSERFAEDSEAFDQFTCGTGGMTRALTLVMAYVGELGKDEA